MVQNTIVFSIYWEQIEFIYFVELQDEHIIFRFSLQINFPQAIHLLSHLDLQQLQIPRFLAAVVLVLLPVGDTEPKYGSLISASS